jgi:hypothetical protein
MFERLKRLHRLKFAESRCKRPLTAFERRNHILQDCPSPSPPWYQMAVIRMNSTYLECVDRMFDERGFVLMVAIIFGTMLGVGLLGVLTVSVILDWDTHSSSRNLEWLAAVGALWIICSPVLYLGYLLARQEIFLWTHYPIRFNRKTRKMHFFRMDGSVLTADWDSLYFTTMWQTFGRRRIAALVLDDDGETVLELCGLPSGTVEGDSSLWSFYEFVRQFMEGDDEQIKRLADQVDYAPDIVERKETFWRGFQYMFKHDTGGYWHLMILSLPTTFLYSVGRWIAMRTCQIPKWPEAIERECAFDENDPCLRDAQHLAPPTAAQAPKATYTPRGKRK